jgi:hypothetical protein
MICRQRQFVFAARRRGIVAGVNPRLAAGVGVLSVFLLFGGAGATIVSADPGNSHSDRGNASSKDNNGSKGSDRGPGNSGRGNGNANSTKGNSESIGSNNTNRNGGSHHASDTSAGSDDDAPKVRVGSGREDQVSSTAGIAGTEAVTGEDPGATGTTGSSLEPGSDHPSAAGPGTYEPPTVEPPAVTFGNGRTPGTRDNILLPPAQAPVQQPAAELPPPPPAPAPSPPSWVDRIAAPLAPTKQLGVEPAADLSDPLWGIAGLLLIPAAGAVLGYRQARASQAVERLRRG